MMLTDGCSYQYCRQSLLGALRHVSGVEVLMLTRVALEFAAASLLPSSDKVGFTGGWMDAPDSIVSAVS
jgi:hypothetical protein